MNSPDRLIYLAGPITGLTYDDARNGWRDEFMHMMPSHIHCLSPMRGKAFIPPGQVIEKGAEYLSTHIIENPRGILTRDTNDVRSSDVIVANFLGAQTTSIGTCAEFGMAHAWQKPLVLIMEPEGNVHHHGFITEIASFWVHNLEDAAEVVKTLLTPGS
jgi:nucleoside 2-deoxyribosyltransferase